MSFLAIKDLGISFGGLTALSSVSMNVEKGQIFSIIGPNGAGKTTIFNCISGIYRPKRGSILFQGQEMVGKKPYQAAKMGIARTFQNIELFSHLSTMDNLLLGRHMHMKSGILAGSTFLGRNFPAAREECLHRERVERIIEFLEIESARDMPVSALPYGTRKLVELGRALAMEPSLLLLDEPTAGMNQEEKRDMMFWIRDIRDDFDVTILMVEHDMNLVMEVSDEIFALNFGIKLVQGPPHVVRNDPGVLEAYLGRD
ncbi:ABC transporter ATP-binding protein [Desulfomonile tiedjei]|uniref:Amino acid/amide ABC transporter ATP-binding protein 1, HAAT family n=1 Tax=Desulfomonile tiedjei (strain ATCC 49306 / DSM 6799 / DCB-1) TaxID=706587 RepID=I4CBM7_DESTA|nr:ABC transporter ATP-binding protein [Desulfomonile tiedjei]AFM26968.1 amino acid/amide ABC transporter ATP-binding protein 1, HAAT family [Desulfomonile tiedjei DSM 6799]